jgi:NAD(P)-dependent dehydrogenase (short-subunit alcohol dehydrogenase family)
MLDGSDAHDIGRSSPHGADQSMREKIVLVTGANSGVGFAAAKALAELGAAVIMVCRDETRGAAAAREVAKVARGPEPVLMMADLSSQRAVRSLASEVRARFARLDALVNNAGAIFSRRELTSDGIEKTFAVNHLAPFLLTNLLLELVRSTPGARIVTVASEVHPGKLEFDNLQGERHYNFLGAYARSKLGNILFTYELARRLEGTGVTSNCLSPGPAATRFGDNLSGLPALFPLVLKRIPFLFISPEQAARTVIQLVASRELAGISGRFFLRQRERRTKSVTYDRDVAARLWSISGALTKSSASAS